MKLDIEKIQNFVEGGRRSGRTVKMLCDALCEVCLVPPGTHVVVLIPSMSFLYNYTSTLKDVAFSMEFEFGSSYNKRVFIFKGEPGILRFESPESIEDGALRGTRYVSFEDHYLHEWLVVRNEPKFDRYDDIILSLRENESRLWK